MLIELLIVYKFDRTSGTEREAGARWTRACALMHFIVVGLASRRCCRPGRNLGFDRKQERLIEPSTCGSIGRWSTFYDLC